MRQTRQATQLPYGGRASQQWLAGRFRPPRAAQQISAFENGGQVPTIAVLAEFYGILRNPSTMIAPDPAEFADWLADWTIRGR